MGKKNVDDTNIKNVLIGVIIGILVAAGSAVGVVFILTAVNGGKRNINTEQSKEVQSISDEQAEDEIVSVGKPIEEIEGDADYLYLTDNYKDFLCGVDNVAKLKYLLAIVENCRENGNNYLKYALSEIWYEKKVYDVYDKTVSPIEGWSAYDIDELNNLYSFITSETITESTAPTMATVSDNLICYKPIDVTVSDKSTIVIKDIKYISGDKMYIEYLYKIVLSVNGDSGIYGQSVAVCEPGADGKYKLVNVENVYRKSYKHSTINDSEFNAEFDSLNN